MPFGVPGEAMVSPSMVTLLYDGPRPRNTGVAASSRGCSLSVAGNTDKPGTRRNASTMVLSGKARTSVALITSVMLVAARLLFHRRRIGAAHAGDLHGIERLYTAFSCVCGRCIAAARVVERGCVRCLRVALPPTLFRQETDSRRMKYCLDVLVTPGARRRMTRRRYEPAQQASMRQWPRQERTGAHGKNGSVAWNSVSRAAITPRR